MSILVIGGTGFVGSKLILRLLRDQKEPSIVCMDTNPPREKFLKSIEKYAGKFHFVQGDVSEFEDILCVIKSFSVQKIVNLSYLLSAQTEKNPRAMAKVNILGMSNVFEAARLFEISRVIFASSNAVYGSQANYGDKEVTEEDIVYPEITYGITKHLNEIMAATYAEQYGTDIVGLRISHIFGHGRHVSGVSRRFSAPIFLPAVGEPAFVETEASANYPLIYVDDVTEFIQTVLNAPTCKYKIYNVAGPSITLAQVADQVRRYIPDAKIEFGHENGELHGARKISCARAKSEFGFTATPLEKTVLAHINEARGEAGLAPLK